VPDRWRDEWDLCRRASGLDESDFGTFVRHCVLTFGAGLPERDDELDRIARTYDRLVGDKGMCWTFDSQGWQSALQGDAPAPLAEPEISYDFAGLSLAEAEADWNREEFQERWPFERKLAFLLQEGSPRAAELVRALQLALPRLNPHPKIRARYRLLGFETEAPHPDSYLFAAAQALSLHVKYAERSGRPRHLPTVELLLEACRPSPRAAVPLLYKIVGAGGVDIDTGLCALLIASLQQGAPPQEAHRELMQRIFPIASTLKQNVKDETFGVLVGLLAERSSREELLALLEQVSRWRPSERASYWKQALQEAIR